MSVKSEMKSFTERLKDANKTFLKDEYIFNRYYQSVEWYIRKANKYKRLYYSFSFAAMLFPLLVPLISLIFTSNNNTEKILVVILSVFTSVFTGLLALGKIHEKWIHYRFIAEKLQAELSLYYSNYKKKEENADTVFLEKIESIMNDEHKKWVDITKKKQ